MRIVVDYDLCEANARCMKACPEIFEVDENDNLIVKQDTFDASLATKVDAAVKACPRQAIRVVKE
jgi:ferredoxin